MMALALVAMTMSATAATTTEYPTRSRLHVVTNSFWANWYLQLGFSGNAAYLSQEKSGLSGNPFGADRGNLGVDFAVGKWFTPGIGLRTKVQGMYANDFADFGDVKGVQFLNVHEDVMFNLNNLFCGYNEKRVWNISLYPGVGYAYNFDDGKGDYSFNFGIINTFRVHKHWNIFLDVWTMFTEGGTLSRGEGLYHAYNGHAKWTARFWDKLVGATVGVTYNLGKCTWDVAPDVDALMAMNQEQLDALNAQLKAEQDENARLRDLLAKKPVATTEVQTVKEVASTNASVFFNIGKAEIASRKDLVNVKEIAEYAAANGNKVVVTGYADSKTGSAEFNQGLSERRANAVADELVKMGVNRDNIEVVAAGGVDTLAPFSYNRRVTVKVAE